MSAPKDAGSCPPVPVNVSLTLFGNRVFADDQVKMGSLGWALIQYDFVLIKRGDLATDTHTDTHRHTHTHTHTHGGHHVKMKAEIGVTHIQAKEHQRWPASHRKPGDRPGTDSSSQPQKETALLTLGSQTSSLQTVRN